VQKWPIDVMQMGAVLLGDNVVCDGFHRARRFRVQTHIHDDHMDEFDTSKGFQDIFLSEATHSLLKAEYDADLLVRQNIFSLPAGARHDVDGDSLILVPSGHMLGAVQAVLETRSGTRLGYSGDFQWPMEDAVEVDYLVLDSTYGRPTSIRRYTQEDAEVRFMELLHRTLKLGPVNITAHRGTIERALNVMAGNINVPILGSDRLCREVGVYQEYGANVAPVIFHKSPEGKAARASERYVRLFSKGDGTPPELPKASSITLSAFMTKPDDPILEYSDRAYGVALSNHADFEGTLEYVRATKAKYVVTDNARGGGGAVELAQEIMARLRIQARPSSNEGGYEWGN